jgi:hypothetical protein
MEQVVARYLHAVQAGQLDEAYGLLSEAYRAKHDRTAFAREVSEEEPSSAAVAAGNSTELCAEVRLQEGAPLRLVLERSGWRLDSSPLHFYPQSTPEEALRSFIRAAERRRYDVLLRFIPNRYRAEFTAASLEKRWEQDERATFSAGIAAAKAHLTDPLLRRGEEARLPLGGHRELHLVREEGIWKVASLE